MIILITGVPGSGKTLYSIGLIKQYLTEQRTVYADIDGLAVPGVLPAPDDWRQAPDGSVVVYDECQQRFGPDGHGRSTRGDIADLETHRHRGLDILLITQHPKLLHSHIRRLVGRHYHVFRMHGSQTAKVFARDGQMDVDKPAYLNQQDHSFWKYPVEDFAAYKSATVHTHKRHVPAWLRRSLIGVVVMGIIIALMIPGTLAFMRGDVFGDLPGAAPTAQAGTVQTAGGSAFVIHDTLPISRVVDSGHAIRACIHDAQRCHCIDEEGYLLRMPHLLCVDLASGMASRYRVGAGSRATRRPTPPTPSKPASAEVAAVLE